MKSEPFSFQYRIADFDLTKLPVDPTLLKSDPAMMVAAVQTFYQEIFRKLGGTANITVKDGVVSVSWLPKAGDAAEQVMEHALSLLRQGDYKTAEPLLRGLLARDANHADALFNLGMMLSDQRKLTEAAALIERFLSLVPDRNGTHLSGGAVSFTMGDFFELVAGFGEQLVGLGSSFFGTRFASFGAQRILHAGDGFQQFVMPSS